MPMHPVALELLKEVGPMAVSSANISGRAAATTVEEAVEQLGDSVGVYLDSGRRPRVAYSLRARGVKSPGGSSSGRKAAASAGKDG